MNRQDQCRLIILEFAEKINESNKFRIVPEMVKILYNHKFSDSFVAKQINYLHNIGAINKTSSKNKDGKYELSQGSWILLSELNVADKMIHRLRSELP